MINTYHLLTALALAALVAAACSGTDETDGADDDDTGDDAGTGGDADSDADGDSDADSDADSDSDSDDCEDGETQCSTDLTVAVCEDGSWVPDEQCEEGVQICQDGECVDCVDIAFTIQTMQACAISVLDGFEMDAEGFIELYGEDHRVFAMDRWEEGHVVAWCDGTTLPELLAAFNVAGYLGQVDDPVVASFGDSYLCNPGAYGDLPAWIDYLGEDLPAEFQGAPADLAANFDVIIFCGFRIPWSYSWAEEIGSFVADHGKGFLAVMEYESLAFQDDFDAMNLITDPAGIHFEPLNLDWAPTSVEVSLECVPDVPPDIE